MVIGQVGNGWKAQCPVKECSHLRAPCGVSLYGVRPCNTRLQTVFKAWTMCHLQRPPSVDIRSLPCCSINPAFPIVLPHHLCPCLLLSPWSLLWLVEITAWSNCLAFMHTSPILQQTLNSTATENLIQGAQPAFKELLIQCHHTIIIWCDHCLNRSTSRIA
jgi:hypothetical protein